MCICRNLRIYSMQIYLQCTKILLVGISQAPFLEKICLPIKTASSYYQRLQPEGLVPQPPNIPLGLTAGSSDKPRFKVQFCRLRIWIGLEDSPIDYKCNDIYIYIIYVKIYSSDLVIRVQDSKFALNLSANVYGVRECKKGPQCPKRPTCPRKARNLLQ